MQMMTTRALRFPAEGFTPDNYFSTLTTSDCKANLQVR